ncbi:MAG TPA: alkaline phosphatase family protein [Gemmatimonadales bacterium]|nr:alkaline phosphatase family protein [Gemmatimonadales bacterium]
MHTRLHVLAALVLAAACAPAPTRESAPAPAPARHRAILVSFDSFNERRALETVPAEATPALRALFRRGACAAYARPAWPSKTAASHASLWTGAYGDVDGIAANSQPPLPRDRHAITELVSGYSAEWLRAEPIWVTAALAGRRVVGHHPTQAPGVPGYPPVTGARDTARAAAHAAAERALADTSAVVLNGYNGHYAPDLALTPKTAPPHAAVGWRNLGRLGPTLPPREIAWRAGDDSVFAVFYGRDRYTHVLVAPERDAARGVVAAAVPAERTSPRGRELARYFSAPLVLAVRPTRTLPAGHVYLRVRLFALAADASDFLLFQPALDVVQANHPAAADAYLAAIGGWVGNGPSELVRTGGLGRPLPDGGDGEAELRYLEALELVTRQFMRGSAWAWARRPDLQVDYFPVADETDHLWYGYVDPASPAYRPALARAIQAMRARAWTLVDLRLAALERLVAGDPDAALFVGGDHGMRATWRAFRPNVALAAAGLLAVDDSGRIDPARTRALAPDGLYVMVNTTDWKQGIVPAESVGVVVERADSALRAVRGPDGAPVVTRTWRVPAAAAAADSLGRGGPVGGVLYWETAPGYVWQRGVKGPAAETARVGADHGFPSLAPDMYTVLCGLGPAFPARRLPPARTIDAAPTVAAWLGIPAPRFARGRAVLDNGARGPARVRVGP